MCCITRYVIKHFYGEGCKCCGLIPHRAHSAAHFVCLLACVCDRGGVGKQCPHSEMLGGGGRSCTDYLSLYSPWSGFAVCKCVIMT